MNNTIDKPSLNQTVGSYICEKPTAHPLDATDDDMNPLVIGSTDVTIKTVSIGDILAALKTGAMVKMRIDAVDRFQAILERTSGISPDDFEYLNFDEDVVVVYDPDDGLDERLAELLAVPPTAEP